VQVLVALLCGLLFGAGLAVSGMTNPAKVLAFLDVAGAWDPTLAFVMGGALIVSALGYQLARRRPRAWLGPAFGIPTATRIDARLIGGAALFGVGWGLVGLCPGPALADLGLAAPSIYIFVGSMVLGVVGFRYLTRERSPAGASRQPS